MIRKILILFLLCCIVVVFEAAAAFFIDTRWTPDLCLLMVIFATLSLGFRYGFATAMIAGLLKEGFVSQNFGTMLVPYLACAYLADYLKRHLSLHESLISRLGVVFVCLLVQIAIQASFFASHHPLDWTSLGMSIVVPQVLTTLVLSEVFFNICRPCASKLFV